MKFPVSLEFSRDFVFPNKILKDPVFNPDDPESETGSVVTIDLPRLITAYPKPGEPAGSERMICRTVGGLLRLELLTSPPPQPPAVFPDPSPPAPWFLLATAALMGSYGGKLGTIQQHTLGPVPLGYESTGAIYGPNPTSVGAQLSLYTVTNMSAGAYGFDYLTSYSNLMDSIFLRVQVTRPTASGVYFQDPIKLRVKGVVLAGDPA